MTHLSTRRSCVALLVLVATVSCVHGRPSGEAPAGPQAADAKATPETKALFTNLERLEGKKVLFGHHDDLAYGVDWVNQPGRSDVKEVAGAYPAVFEWEMGGLERDRVSGTDGARFDQVRQWIIDGYAHNAVTVLSWHMSNPVTGGNAWDTTVAVSAILPGGPQHDTYMRWLDRFAAFAMTLRSGRRLVPVILRPFHEASGSWFWWGGRHRSPEEYQALWRFTVEYLRDKKRVHNVLYAYSPDVFDSTATYLASYPGDAYVDVLGLDDYQSIKTPATRAVFAGRLRNLVEMAEARGKIPALTETGVEGIPDSTWWTGTLLAGIKSDTVGARIVWVSVWRNANHHHFYAPFVGHPSAADFVKFRADPLMAFQGDVGDLYHTGRP
jgi:mannan endo-1,4-beta-mannosidase